MKKEISKQTTTQKLNQITDILANLLKNKLPPEADLQVLEAQELALEVQSEIAN